MSGNKKGAYMNDYCEEPLHELEQCIFGDKFIKQYIEDCIIASNYCCINRVIRDMTTKSDDDLFTELMEINRKKKINLTEEEKVRYIIILKEMKHRFLKNNLFVKNNEN